MENLIEITSVAKFARFTVDKDEGADGSGGV